MKTNPILAVMTVAALGLGKAAAALWVANDAVGSAMDARHDVERDRAEERATGSTPELRKVVAGLLVKAARRVNAVYEINPENEKAAKAIGDVAAIVEHYKRVAAEFKGNKKDAPAPNPNRRPHPRTEGDRWWWKRPDSRRGHFVHGRNAQFFVRAFSTVVEIASPPSGRFLPRSKTPISAI